jgi:hypothetical protein
MKKMMKKSSSKSANVTASKSKSAIPAGASTKATGKQHGANGEAFVQNVKVKDKVTAGTNPSSKFQVSPTKKMGGAMSKYKSGGQGPANKIGKMVKISKKMK